MDGFGKELRGLGDINELSKLMSEMDVTEFEIKYQLYLSMAFTEFMTKVKPVYLKYAAKDPEVTNFIFKL